MEIDGYSTQKIEGSEIKEDFSLLSFFKKDEPIDPLFTVTKGDHVVKENMVGSFPGEMDIVENVENKKDVTSTKKNDKLSTGMIVGLSFYIIFIILWAILGISGLIMSMVCFGYTGSVTEKAIGIIIAMLVGPLYWIYFYYNKNYCGKKNRNM